MGVSFLNGVYAQIEVINVEVKELIQAVVDRRSPFRRFTNQEVCSKLNAPPTLFWAGRRQELLEQVQQQHNKNLKYTESQVDHFPKGEKHQDVEQKLQPPPVHIFEYNDEFLTKQDKFISTLDTRMKAFKMNLDNVVAVKQFLWDEARSKTSALMEFLTPVSSTADVIETQAVNKMPSVVFHPRPHHLKLNVDRSTDFPLIGSSNAKAKETDTATEIEDNSQTQQSQGENSQSSAVVVSLIAVLFSILC